tara:strand:- start:2961 stop:3365 length:405 start_codon:yes stop_codon:yes gene_type:complete
MAVQQIIGKKITKYDTEKLESNPNFIKPEKDEMEIVNGNLKENFEEDVYGERKHSYIPEPNGNLQMEQMMGKLMNKLDNFGSDSQTGVKAVEVDIQREIAIGKVDSNAVKSEEFKGKVNNKLDKLKKLRRRNGR